MSPISISHPVPNVLANTRPSDFDRVVTSYRTLSTRTLRTLHLSIRATILHSLTHALPPNLSLDTPLNDPSPTILALNANLTTFDTTVPASVSAHGLAHLTDTYLLNLCTTRIQRMNAHGCAHMHLNVLVLQQNLKNIEHDAALPYSALYFDLFTAGPEAIVARAKQYGKGFGVKVSSEEGRGGFDEESVKALLEMTYEERLMGENRESSVGARRALDAGLLEISEFMY